MKAQPTSRTMFIRRSDPSRKWVFTLPHVGLFFITNRIEFQRLGKDTPLVSFKRLASVEFNIGD